MGYLDAGPVTPSSHVTGGDPGVTAPQPAPGTHHRSRDGSRAASRARPALHRAPPVALRAPLCCSCPADGKNGLGGWCAGRRGTNTERRVTSVPSGDSASKMRDHARFGATLSAFLQSWEGATRGAGPPDFKLRTLVCEIVNTGR